MVNAESFKQKIKERTEKLTEEISAYIQTVLNNELQKDNVQVPFIIGLDKLCKDNIDIVKSVANILGFKVTIEEEHSFSGIKVKFDFTTVVNNKAHVENLSDMIRKASDIMDAKNQNPLNVPDFYSQYMNNQIGR